MNQIRAVDVRRTALVTGAARRIGAAIARDLHCAGLNVVIHYRCSAPEAQALCAELNDARPSSAATLQCDLLDTEHLGEFVAEAIARFGRLDVLVNNASTFYPTPLDTATPIQWDELLGSNLKSPFFLVQAAAPELRRQGGSIVNLVDVHGRRPMAGHPVYCTAKAGLAMLTRALALDLAPNVRVNGVAPGAIVWSEHEHSVEVRSAILNRTPIGKLGTVDDIARTVRFLALESPYITGQILAVDGGRTLNM